MRRPKVKKLGNMFIQTQPTNGVAPWDNNNQQINCDGRPDDIPTYRRQIVKKFLGNIHSKNKIVPERLTKQLMDQDHNKIIALKKQFDIRPATMQLRRKMRTQGSSQDKQYMQAFKIFKQQFERVKKPKLKTKIINLNLQVPNTKTKKPSNTQCVQQASKIFTRKLRLKQQIATKKNIEQVKKIRQSKTVSNIFQNPFYLYQFGNIDFSKDVRSNRSRNCHTAYRRASSLRSKNSSSQSMRPKSNEHYYYF